MESLYLLILAFFIIFLVVPFTYNIRLSYDLDKNSGTLSLHVFFIPLYRTKFKRKGATIILIKKQKEEELELEIGEPQLRYLKFFYDEVKNKIKIRKIDTKSEIGFDNPFNSAIISTVYSSIVLAIFARLKSLQPSASFRLDNNTNFCKSTFSFNIFFRLAISNFDVLYSLIVAFMKTKNDILLSEKLENL